MNTARQPVIILFIKSPAPGQVKSRLAGAIGDYLACELYKRFVFDTFETTAAVTAEREIFFFPADARSEINRFLEQEQPAIECFPQQGRDLGERMANAFSTVFHSGRTGAVLIGSDIPALTPAIVGEALNALSRFDAVIGPATDGGYYLIGFTAAAFQPAIFAGIEWSTPSVYARTTAVLRREGMKIRVLPELSDIDTVTDLKIFFDRSGDTAHSRTIAFLKANETTIFAEQGGHP